MVGRLLWCRGEHTVRGERGLEVNGMSDTITSVVPAVVKTSSMVAIVWLFMFMMCFK